MPYLFLLLVFTACAAPKAEQKQEAAAEAQKTAADTPADISNNRPDDIGAGGVFDADKMWGDKNPYRTLPDGRVLSYTNGYGIELVNLEQVMTDIEIAEFLETNKNLNKPDFERNYSWYYRSSPEIRNMFPGDLRIYLMDVYFYSYVRGCTLYNARDMEGRLNADSLIPVNAETLYKGFPKLHTKAVQEAINIYVKQIDGPQVILWSMACLIMKKKVQIGRFAPTKKRQVYFGGL